MASEDEIADFIRLSFRSVWSQELLLLLKRDPRLWPSSCLGSAGLLTLAVVPDEKRSLLYLIRLAAFALTLAAIIRKNCRFA